jgi:hypothetical protein
VPTGLVEQNNGSISYLNPGDVITLDDGGYGHAAIIESYNPSTNTVTIINQNTQNVTTTAYIESGSLASGNADLHMNAFSGYDVQAIIHAPGGRGVRAQPNDFNGLGKSDVALGYNSTIMFMTSTGSGFTNSWNTSGWGTPTKAVTGDFDGDTKSDILWLQPSGGAYVAQIMASTGSGFTNAWNNSGWGLPTWIGTGYFNTDNRSDVALYYPASSGGGGPPVLQILTSTGSGFTNSWNTYSWGSPTKAVVGDYTGDGYSDILWLEPSGGAYVAQIMASTGSGFTNAWNNSGWGLPVWLASGDFDANGKSGIALDYSSVLQVMTSTGSGFSNSWNAYGWGSPALASVGFYNNDDKSDILWLQPSGGAYVAQIMASTGSGFTNAWNSSGWGLPVWMSE